MIHRAVYFLAVAALSVCVPYGQAFAAVTGDLAAVREVIDAYRANRAKIDTWRGRVVETDYDVVDERESTKTQSTIEFYLRVSTGQLRTLRTFGTLDDANPATLNSIVAGGKLTYRSHASGSAGESDVHVQTFAGPLLAVPAEYCFNPMWYFDVEDEDLAERLTRILKGAGEEADVDWVVTREKTIVTIRRSRAESSEQLVCDLYQGGNITNYESHTAAADVKTRWEYASRSDVWVPSFIRRQELERFKQVGGERQITADEQRRRVHMLEWTNNEVNLEYPEGDFSLRCIKVAGGDLIHDEIAGVSYHYTVPPDLERAASPTWVYLVLAGVAAAVIVFLARRVSGRTEA